VTAAQKGRRPWFFVLRRVAVSLVVLSLPLAAAAAVLLGTR
jgi:hypothetical protein